MGLLSFFLIILPEVELEMSLSGLSVNTLTADDKDSLLIWTLYRNQFKCNYLRNKKLFISFLLHVWDLHQILNIWKKR